MDGVGDSADSATGGRFGDQIDSVENAAEGFVDKDGSAGTRER
ncbi:MAG: Rv0909 family putative TA system antitoxin [Candidatus Limnocylindria bacterium]